MRENGARRIKVLLADDHAMFCEALAGAMGVEDDVEVVGVTALEAATLVAVRSRPDVVVMEVQRSIEEAGEAVAQLLAVPSGPGLVVLSASRDGRLTSAVLDAGAGAFVSKDAALEDLLLAVRAVARGRRRPDGA